MNSVERTALLFHRDTIVQNVDLNYIKEKLIAYSILNHDELEEIDYEKTRSAKIRKLLDLLPRKGPKSFVKFVKSLEADYDWLAEKLVKFSNPDSPDAAANHSSTLNNGDIHDSLTTILQEALIIGGIPFPPPYMISREQKLQEIRQHLREMTLGQFIVLHGMAGTGKSVLAAESIRDIELMINTFDSNIFWLTIGQTDKDTLLTRMQALCERLDQYGVPPLSVDQATERLRRLMSDPSRKNSLLILDDVWRGEVVRAFDFGCKIMLTTRDATVIDVVQGRARLVKVQDGFSQEESMLYLANCLQLTEQELPDQAYQIYSESKGSPMVLSILAPVLAGRSPQRIDTDRWDHYVGKLRDRKYTQMRRQDSYSYETINEAIGISFDHLDEDIRSLLNDFVIFMDDVNIPAPVLEVLWGLSRYEVEEKMMILLKKSLIAQHVNEQSYRVMYGMHDLLLDYLKSRMTDTEQQMVHRKLVDAYFSKCGGDFGSLPNDNYIFWFLGYHLYKADYAHHFPEIYLNLNFISAKLRATGPSDLLNDFRKYVDYISGKEGEHSQHVEDFTRFIRTCGHIVVQCPQLDIVQLALQQPKNSQVYRTALSNARIAKNDFYVEWCNREEIKGQVLRSTVLNYGHVTAACFTEDGQRLLSAIGDGQIRMWDIDSGKELHRFTGHNGSVHHLALSSDRKRLVSSSADGTVKVWDILSITRKLDDALHRPTKTPSPRMRQDSWHNMFDVSGRVISDSSLTTYSGHTNEVLCSQFSDNGALIVSCGMDRTARVWLSIAPMELGVLKHPEFVRTCCFSPEGNYIATGCTDSTIRIWSASNYSCIALFHEQSSRVLFVSFLSDTSLLSVSDTEILLWNWRYPSEPGSEEPAHSVNAIGSNNHSSCYQSAAIDDSRQLLAVATSNDNIILINIVQGCQVFEFIGHTGAVTSLHFAPTTRENEPPRSLLSGSLDETVMVWNVNVDHIEDNSLSATALHAMWDSSNKPNLFVTASVRSDNKIELMTGFNALSLHTTEAESEPVEQCVISHGIAMLAWGTQSGLIRLLSLKTKSVKLVGHHSDRRLTLLKFSPSDVLLLSASEDGCVKIWKHSGDCVTIWGPRKGIVNCHFVDRETQLLTCGVDGSVRIWRVDSGQPMAVLLQDIGFHVLCFDLSTDGTCLAQGTSTHGLQLISVNSDLKKLNRQPMRLGHQKSPARICRFATSQSRPFVAVGYDSGLIEVYDYTRHLLHSTLEAHRSWVRDLQFVRNSPFFQLVSIGDRIAWWSLLQNNSQSNHTTAVGMDRGYRLPLTPITPGSNYYSNGSTSVSDDGKIKNPIQTFEFQGRFASKLFASPDGSTVLTVTDAGILYILRQLADG